MRSVGGAITPGRGFREGPFSSEVELRELVEDVLLGCAFPEGEAGMNVARVAALKAGLPVSVPGQTINRFCASGLQTIASAVMRYSAPL